jgi:hypothetical protein
MVSESVTGQPATGCAFFDDSEPSMSAFTLMIEGIFSEWKPLLDESFKVTLPKMSCIISVELPTDCADWKAESRRVPTPKRAHFLIG